MRDREARRPAPREGAGAIRRGLAGCAIGALVCLAGARAEADEPAASGWQFSITPYLWATSLNGDIAVRGRSADVDASFVDILDATDSIIGIEGHGEAWNGDWGFYVDGIYNRLTVEDARSGIITIDIESVTELSIVEAGVIYRIGDWPLATGWSGAPPDGPRLELDAYAGARYTSIDIDNKVTIAGLTTKEGGDEQWIDPLVGLRTILSLDRRWQLMLGGDIGGFGAGSEFSWSAIGLVGYRYELFGLAMTSVAGYKALSQDFDDGSGNRRVEWDMIMHGPIVGTVIRF